MARKRTPRTGAGKKRPIETYEHKDKQRVNNPPVGLVTPQTDPETSDRKTYAHDPHLDPQLSWAGKAEHTSFDIPTVSLHVHERIDPRSIIEAVRKVNGDHAAGTAALQLSLFAAPAENPPLREAVEFYRHRHGWSNRLVAGDSLLVMNSLLEKEGLGGKVQMVYLDPPYGIKYGSNFQPFVNKRDVKDGKDDDLTAEPEQIRAFRDTWELGIHSYLTYLRDRLLLARELLAESGSIFVQISDENVHHVRELMDEVFQAGNRCALIPFRKRLMPLGAKLLEGMADYIVWYAKDINAVKYRHLYRRTEPTLESRWTNVELPNGERRKITREEADNLSSLPKDSKVYRLVSQRKPEYFKENDYTFTFQGRNFHSPVGGCWMMTKDKMQRAADMNRLEAEGDSLSYILYHEDFPYSKITAFWTDTAPVQGKRYVVQTSDFVIQRCLLMTTDPGDLVFDPTCGSGTTAFVAEQWGRRWITCDTSRVALTLARQRLMTAVFDFYELAHPQEGVGSGFVYKTVPHITLKSIANNEPPTQETLYDQPLVDRKKTRVSGPFTVEAVPAPAVKALDEVAQTSTSAFGAEKNKHADREVCATSDEKNKHADREVRATLPPDASIARSGETLRQSDWRDELLRAGIRGKAGQMIKFARLEPLPGCRWLHADGESRPNGDGNDRVREGAAAAPQRIVVSFGPEHGPLEQRQVERAWEEARTLAPRPALLLFAAFQFDPEAAKDIDELTPKMAGMQLLKVQMNADLLTDDLKKKRASNESFWLIGQPDVRLVKVAQTSTSAKSSGAAKKQKHAGVDARATMYQVIVEGFDYYNTKTGGIESGGSERIAVWMLDTDYDGRSLFPRQVFFPMAGEKEGWARLAKNLKAEIDEDLIEAYRGTESLPFAPGKNKRAAVKIVDDRGIESLKIIEID